MMAVANQYPAPEYNPDEYADAAHTPPLWLSEGDRIEVDCNCIGLGKYSGPECCTEGGAVFTFLSAENEVAEDSTEDGGGWMDDSPRRSAVRTLSPLLCSALVPQDRPLAPLR